MNEPQNLPSFSVQRAPDGKFLPGSGGRPPGTRNRASKARLTAVTDLFSESVAVLKKRLSEGDLTAARIVLDVCLPKNRAVEFGDDVSPATIEAALADGTITPNEALTAAQALEKIANVRDVADLVARVEELEAVLSARNGR